MAILYALVARGTVVLAEFTATSTNASTIAKKILDKVPENNKDDSNISYSQDRYVFHVKRTDGLTVLCMAEENTGSNSALSLVFVEDIHKRFVRTYGRAVYTAQSYAMNEEFSRVLCQQIEYYSNGDRINGIKVEMNQMRDVMIENIDEVLNGGERLELLINKTVNMQGKTLRFRKQARRFRRIVWWRNCKITILLILLLLLLVIIYIGVAFVCHGRTLPSCF